MSHLVLRRYLKIGDSGFHNILYVDPESQESLGTQLIVGNDMEEFNSAATGSSSDENWADLIGLVERHGLKSADPIIRDYIQLDNIVFDKSFKNFR